MDVKLPPLGEGADSGTVVSIAVKAGDPIQKGQTLIELENEKAVASIPSPADGQVGTIFVKEGDKIAVGQRILSLSDGAKPSGMASAAAAAKAKAKANAQDEGASAQPHGGPPPAEAAEPETANQAGDSADEAPLGEAPANDSLPAASPTIRKLARDIGLDLRRVRGSERGGRIVLSDVRAYIQRLEKLAFGAKGAATPSAPPRPVSVDFSQWGPVQAKPFSPLRQTISRRLTESWTTIPHVTQFDEADITSLLALRKKHAAAYDAAGAHLTLTSFALKAVVGTLQKYPLFNSSLDEAKGELIFKDYFHVGVAVDTEGGLIVPVIRDVDKKSLLDLSKELKKLAERARDRKVGLEEMKGGTFTISNQGSLGGTHFTPIINKPEVAILGLGQGRVKPAVRDEKVEARTLLPLALSYDHRVIDGGQAARFIKDLVAAFEGFKEETVTDRASEAK